MPNLLKNTKLHSGAKIIVKMEITVNQTDLILKLYKFSFLNLPIRLMCMLCKQVLRNAKQTSCGCKACQGCIEKYLIPGKMPCPSGQLDCANVILETDCDINSDNATNKEIYNITVKCPFGPCDVHESLKNMAHHIDRCDYKEVTCELCQTIVAKKELEIHNEHTCELRKVACEHCQRSFGFRHLNQVHLNLDSEEICSGLVGVCPNKCTIIDNVNLKDHLVSCVNKKLECPFKDLDCTSNRISRQNLDEHIHSNLISHLSSLVEKVQVLERKLSETVEKLEMQKTITKELSDMNSKRSSSEIHMTKILNEIKKKYPSANRSFDAASVFRDGNFVWRLADFQSMSNEAESSLNTSASSIPFYTSDFGYKMCLKIYPIGDGSGKGTHLSLFFVIMKGEYDDLLSWPFKQKVTISLLDQISGANHRTDVFKPDFKSPSFRKPTDDCNVASGSPKFISLSEVLPGSIYNKNNCLFLKITVDPFGISRP